MNNYNPLNIKTHHYPFGSVMPGRSYSSGDYRYGFNGKESDNEVSGNGNSYDYGFRIYNPRIGKFLSRDPLSKNYPHLTPYQFASNTPIQASDLDGLEAIQEIQYVYEGTSIATVTNYWLESNDERVQLILHDLGTGTTSEIWYNPVEIKYEPSSSEKFLAGVQKVNNTVNDFNNSIRNIPQKMDGLQSSMMGNTYGELEGEQGLIKSNDAAKNVGLVLLASPAYPVGEGILLFTDIVESGLDFKNKPFKEALGNTVIRASMFGTGESLSIFKSSVFKPNGGFEEAVDRLTHMGAEALENKTTDELIKTKKDGGGKAQE
jgi:RHS repeat-associated protein